MQCKGHLEDTDAAATSLDIQPALLGELLIYELPQ